MAVDAGVQAAYLASSELTEMLSFLLQKALSTARWFGDHIQLSSLAGVEEGAQSEQTSLLPPSFPLFFSRYQLQLAVLTEQNDSSPACLPQSC